MFGTGVTSSIRRGSIPAKVPVCPVCPDPGPGPDPDLPVFGGGI
jgi:hypothetical protein